MSRYARFGALAAIALFACSDDAQEDPTVVFGEISGPAPVIEQSILELDVAGENDLPDVDIAWKVGRFQAVDERAALQRDLAFVRGDVVVRDHRALGRARRS